MPISQPQNLLTKPFADDGNYQVIPVDDAGTGRASLSQGFPIETQRPLAQGGIAPNRLDFNGILHMLSAAMFWQQSGGQWAYKNTLNYTIPCMVFHNGDLWWCARENGPDSTVVTPGTNLSFWIRFADFLGIGDIDVPLGTPVGTVIAYMGNIAPEGYLVCDGSTFSATQYPKLHALLGTTITPDLRAEFLRGVDNGRGMDPDLRTSVNVGQMDAIQNITGTFHTSPHTIMYSGAFVTSSTITASSSFSGQANWGVRIVDFNASRVARTALETRPHNVTVLWCIKHD